MPRTDQTQHRPDTYLLSVGDPTTRLQDTLTRAAAYVAAGADGIFVPGVTDPAIVSALVDGLAAPLNLMTGPGAPPVDELAELGVVRVSLGAAIALAAYALVQRSAHELLTAGTHTILARAGALDYGELNALLHSRSKEAPGGRWPSPSRVRLGSSLRSRRGGSACWCRVGGPPKGADPRSSHGRASRPRRG
jgi:2-methylisocitrate lyase-like PEP mutase family enzyme